MDENSFYDDTSFSFSADTSTLRANIANYVEVRCTLSLHSDTASLYAETLTSYADIMLRARCVLIRNTHNIRVQFILWYSKEDIDS